MGIMNILISAPITYIIFIRDPFSGSTKMEDRDKRWVFDLSFGSYLGINIIFFIWGLVM